MQARLNNSNRAHRILGIDLAFPVREKIKMNLRWEMFNMFNHARFGNPGVNVNSANTFGVITGALDPRIMEVAAKLIF